MFLDIYRQERNVRNASPDSDPKQACFSSVSFATFEWPLASTCGSYRDGQSTEPTVNVGAPRRVFLAGLLTTSLPQHVKLRARRTNTVAVILDLANLPGSKPRSFFMVDAV